MFNFIVGVLCGERPGVVVSLVVTMIAMAEFLRYSAYACDRAEMVARIRWAHGFFRLAPLLLILLVHRQTVEVRELREIVIARGAAVEALPIAEHVAEYSLTTPSGTRISWSQSDAGLHDRNRGTEFSGFGSGVVGTRY